MSTTLGPLMAFGARGGIASQLIFQKSKGNTRVKAWAKPTNPNTAAQQSCRSAMQIAANAWRSYFTAAADREAWARTAKTAHPMLSAYNAYLYSALPTARTNPSASYDTLTDQDQSYMVYSDMVNLDDGATGDESGYFKVWHGLQPNLLLDGGESEMSYGQIWAGHPYDPGTVFYYKLTKDGYDRTGLYKFTAI